jgi:hypothetical protein
MRLELDVRQRLRTEAPAREIEFKDRVPEAPDFSDDDADSIARI